MPSGGPRTPANPAPVSGPGALSKRTDGGQPVRVAAGGDYGDRQALERLQQSAPMSDTARAPGQSDAPFNPDGHSPNAWLAGQHMGEEGRPGYSGRYEGGALNAPSTRPGEPVTHGSPLGAGAGPEALSGSAPQAPGVGPMTQLLQSMATGGATGALADLLRSAQMHNA